jgi:multidrug efflux pump subunit AcrA (membrane-fusion protein)
MKKILVIGVLVLGGLWVCKKTNLCSYASTLWAKGQRAVKGQVPRQFELDRIRHEIDKLDGDVRAMLGPIAEKQAAFKRLEREVKNARANRETMREGLLSLTRKVEAGTQTITWNETDYTLDQAKARLAREFVLFKALDTSLKTREQLLRAQQQSLQLAHEQLRRIAEQKGHFEARLAQLEATEEYLNLQAVSSPLRIDEGRVADIKNTLDAIEQGQETAKEQRILENQFGPRPNRPAEPCCPNVNTQEILNFLGVPTNGQSKVASSK